VQDGLSKGRLARYAVEVVEGLDLSELVQAYAGTGCTAYHPAMRLPLLIDGYATGCFSVDAAVIVPSPLFAPLGPAPRDPDEASVGLAPGSGPWVRPDAKCL
jgi:hypothetical protein